MREDERSGCMERRVSVRILRKVGGGEDAGVTHLARCFSAYRYVRQ